MWVEQKAKCGVSVLLLGAAAPEVFRLEIFEEIPLFLWLFLSLFVTGKMRITFLIKTAGGNATAGPLEPHLQLLLQIAIQRE